MKTYKATDLRVHVGIPVVYRYRKGDEAKAIKHLEEHNVLIEGVIDSVRAIFARPTQGTDTLSFLKHESIVGVEILGRTIPLPRQR